MNSDKRFDILYDLELEDGVMKAVFYINFGGGENMVNIDVNGSKMCLTESVVEAVLKERGYSLFTSGYMAGMKKANGESEKNMVEAFEECFATCPKYEVVENVDSKIREMHRAGYSTYEIAERLNITEHKVVSVIFPRK